MTAQRVLALIKPLLRLGCHFRCPGVKSFRQAFPLIEQHVCIERKYQFSSIFFDFLPRAFHAIKWQRNLTRILNPQHGEGKTRIERG